MNTPHILSSASATTPKEHAYECLKNWIIYSEIKPGTPLRERELAERFGISRTPLREILQRLAYQRLIEIRPRQGIFVAPIDFLTIKSIFEARLPLERTTAALAAKRARDEEIEAMGAVVAEMRQAREAGDFKGIIRLDESFHIAMGKAARNEVMEEILEDLHNVCLRFWKVNERLNDEYNVVEELELVMDALRRRDAAETADSIGAHVWSFLLLFDEDAARTLQQQPPATAPAELVTIPLYCDKEKECNT